MVVYTHRPRWTLERKQEDHKLIRRFSLKEQQQQQKTVLPSAFSQENLVLKPRTSLTRI